MPKGRRFNLDELPSEHWFQEAEKEVNDLYISSLTCNDVDNMEDKGAEFKSTRCTYCERVDHCYKNSLGFKDLINEAHLIQLKNLADEQIEDILYDLKRTTFICPECYNDFENETCHSCNGEVMNGFHQFLSELDKISEHILIERFIDVEEMMDE